MPLLYEEETYKIRGSIFNVYNTLGFGHKEDVYQKALSIEFKKNNIKFEEQKSLNIIYNSEKVGNYRPDFIADDKIIIEIKATEFTLDKFKKQLKYYLSGTNYQLGLLVNFGSSKLEIHRIIWTPHYK
ncbi:GxxExxY protein [Patescibacteria group bacterium]|nr:GxxExxY protein [Patescibacteria group bacterium]